MWGLNDATPEREKVFVVVGMWYDTHEIVAVYRSKKKAVRRKNREQKKAGKQGMSYDVEEQRLR